MGKAMRPGKRERATRKAIAGRRWRVSHLDNSFVASRASVGLPVGRPSMQWGWSEEIAKRIASGR